MYFNAHGCSMSKKHFQVNAYLIVRPEILTLRSE